MALLTIDKTNEDNFEEKSFKLLPKGNYRFTIAKKLKVEKAKTSSNNIIKLELKCIDEAEDGKYLGTTVFDNIVLIPKGEWKLNAFAMSSGIYTKEQLQESGEIDTDDFIPDDVEVTASIDIETSEYQGKTTTRNVVKAYLFKE